MRDIKISRKRWLADLLWAANSPNLLSVNETFFPPHCVAESVDVKQLANWCIQNRQARVGLYFEDLVHYLLAYQFNYRILLRHQQVFNGKQTVGEIDFVFQSDEGLVTHLETAVKFFLYYPQSKGFESHYIGPNSADNLVLKTRRLLEHQLPLSDRISLEIDRKLAWVKGRVFFNPELNEPITLDEILNPGVSRCVWVWYKQLPFLFTKYAGCSFAHLRKPYWLAEVNAHSVESHWDNELAARKLQDHFEYNCPIGDQRGFGRPVLLAIMSGDRHATEIARVFVVPDAWPYDRAEQIVS